jgi:hypothetical protein
MLNGIAPIIIFNFKKLVPALETLISESNIPLLETLKITDYVPLIPIPLYLDEKFTGLFIDTEDKNVDIKTDTETRTDGKAPTATQVGLSNVVTINMLANKNSLGLNLLLAMADLVFEKVTSKEYSISYLHGAIAVFNGLLEGFSATQDSNTDVLHVQIKIARQSGSTIEKLAPLTLDKVTGAIPAL